MSVDKFALHPELRDLIADPATSRFRRLSTASVTQDLEKMGLKADFLRPDADREAARRAFMAGHDGDLWVFAYGSLMWDPALHFTQVRRANLPGYARRFILRDSSGGRGTPDAPGVMAALDHGTEGCDGLAYLIDAASVAAETMILWQREMIGWAYAPVLVPVETRNGPLTCLTFVADYDAPSIVPDITRAEQIQCLATGQGILGTSLDYLRGIHRHFVALGIDDPSVASLLAEAEAAVDALN